MKVSIEGGGSAGMSIETIESRPTIPTWPHRLAIVFDWDPRLGCG